MTTSEYEQHRGAGNGPNGLGPMKGPRYDSRCCKTCDPPSQRIRTDQNRHSNVPPSFAVRSRIRCLTNARQLGYYGAPWASLKVACQGLPAHAGFRSDVSDVKSGIREVGRLEPRFLAALADHGEGIAADPTGRTVIDRYCHKFFLPPRRRTPGADNAKRRPTFYPPRSIPRHFNA
jgi:hypothetical protein